MRPRAPGTLRMILHAAARVLGCNSAQIGVVDGESLVLQLGVNNAERPLVTAVEGLLGFTAEGASLPLATEDSLLARAVREARLLVTARFSDLVGNLVPEDVAAQIQSVIGPNTFAAVPLLGRAGAVGVILLVKEGEAGFAPADRDLLVAYADRLGVALESEGLGGDSGQPVAAPGEPDLGLPPPTVHFCDRQLTCVDGDEAGAPLWRVLRAHGAQRALAEAAARSDGEAVLVPYRTDDGRSMRLTLRPTGGRGPFPAGLVAVAEEIGWLERLGREAARAREHLARVLGSVSDAVFTIDAHGTVVGCNAAVHKMLGVTAAAVLGRPIVDLVADDRSRRRASQMGARLEAAGYAEVELDLLRGGRAIPAAVSALLLADDEGRPAGALWRARDLSERRRGDAERKRLRARLLRTERLSALGEMAARIAHEVRNPLVSIGAAARLVEEELGAGGPSSEVIGEVQAIQREVVRLDGIVSGFLHFARDHRALPAPRERVELGQLVGETLALLKARGPEVGLRLDSDGACATRGDPDGIRQVLWNVLANAVEASPVGAEVVCELRAAAGRVQLSVSDEGPGIDAAVRRRAFDPFYSTKARGTGLGLAITRQIVEEHGGRIRLLRRRRGGTTVRIDLPSA